MQFGRLQIHAEKHTRHGEYKDLNYISNQKDPETNLSIGLNGADVEKFHSDLAWSSNPTAITFLLSIVKPRTGGKNNIFYT